MTRTAIATALACVLIGTVAGCEAGAGSTLGQPTTDTDAAAVVDDHESGPQSPIAFGLSVPRGATQLGPLARYRSARLIEAYADDLDAAMARRGVLDARRYAEANADGLPQEVPPTPPSVNRPSKDSFDLLDDPPKPDTTVSLMRVDGDPSEVVHHLVSQIATLLPDADIDPDDLTSYCEVTDERVSGCLLDVTGTTENDRQLQITMAVDPGDITTRTSPPSSFTRPVIQLSVAYTGDPRTGQTEPEGRADVQAPDDERDESMTIVWPRMDVDAPRDTELLNGWTQPDGTTMLLSGFTPPFVSLAVRRGKHADSIAREFAASVGDDVTVTKDVVEELNEIRTTYTSENADGDRAVATYVLSARGNYVMLFLQPA